MIKALLFISFFVLIHDDADWIRKQNKIDPRSQLYCCGPGDCEKVQITIPYGLGYLLPSFNEIVPAEEVQPSSDGNFWRCKKPDGSRRCFFAPYEGY